MNNTPKNHTNGVRNTRMDAFLIKYQDQLKKHKITKSFVRDQSHLFMIGMSDEMLFDTLLCIWDECHMGH